MQCEEKFYSVVFSRINEFQFIRLELKIETPPSALGYSLRSHVVDTTCLWLCWRRVGGITSGVSSCQSASAHGMGSEWSSPICCHSVDTSTTTRAPLRPVCCPERNLTWWLGRKRKEKQRRDGEYTGTSKRTIGAFVVADSN